MLAHGAGISGSRCLVLRPDTDSGRNVSAFPVGVGHLSNFEAFFDALIECPTNRTPAVGFGFVLNLPEGIPAPRLPPVDPVTFPRNTWLTARATLRGTDYCFEVFQSTNRIARRAFYLRTPGAVPGVNLETDDKSCRLLVDNFRIRRLE